jgi:RNA polymerase-binding transcription factor DksA
MDLKKYKTKLEEEKKLLEEELSGLGRVDKSGDWEATPEGELKSQDVEDEADVDDRAEDYEERSSILNSLEKRLGDTNNALKKIEDNNYGICEMCGKEIEEERLDANASSITCIDCISKII